MLNSIKKNGFIFKNDNPLKILSDAIQVVEIYYKNNFHCYGFIEGHHRLAIAQLLKIEKIPVTVFGRIYLN